MSEQQAKAAAGWYPHPEMAGTQRYWDGQAWTDNITPLQTSPSVQMVASEGKRMYGQTLPTPVITVLVVTLGLFFFFFIIAGVTST